MQSTSQKIFQEASQMKKEIKIVSSALASLALAAATFAVPANTNAAKQSSGQTQQIQTQSVSGKIASVDKSSFTLNVGSSATNPGNQMQQTSPKTMTFMVDKNTTVDGKLKVGSNADVTYREEGGNNIAVSVRVSQ
jgi:hypothetical protein